MKDVTVSVAQAEQESRTIYAPVSRAGRTWLAGEWKAFRTVMVAMLEALDEERTEEKR